MIIKQDDSILAARGPSTLYKPNKHSNNLTSNSPHIQVVQGNNSNVKPTQVTAVKHELKTIKQSLNNNNYVNQTNESVSKATLPFVSSNIDDFMNNNKSSSRDHNISTSSGENDDNDDGFEPYSRRDFRIDVKPDKNNDTPSSGYFTSPNENEKFGIKSNRNVVLSPDTSSDYEKYEYNRNVVKNRDNYSSSPADSQSGRSVSSQHRKSVSFDLDVEEFTPAYSIEQEARRAEQQFIDEEDVFYEQQHYAANQTRFHHQEPKRIKGILRSPSPNVYYQANIYNRGAVEKGYVDDDNDDNDNDSEEIEKENPFRKEYLSQEELNQLDNEEPVTVPSMYSDSDQFDHKYQNIRRSFENLSSSSLSHQASKIPIKKPIFKSTGSLAMNRPKIPPPRPPPPPPKPKVKVADIVQNEALEKLSKEMLQEDFVEFIHDAQTNQIIEVSSLEDFTPDDPLPPLPATSPPPLLSYKRVNSSERPKESPPPPPPPAPASMAHCQQPKEVIEMVPAKFEMFQRQQKPSYVNENSRNNILVSEEEHREFLLQENEIRNALMTEYEANNYNIECDTAITNISSTNPFLDDASSSFSSSSFQSTSNVSTMERQQSTSYSNQYLHYQSPQPPINILPPTQVLPVHYSQLPKPQKSGYYPLMSHQYPINYNTQPTGVYHHQQQQQQHPHQQMHHQQQQQQQQTQQFVSDHSLRGGYLVSGDGQNNFYVSNHNINNQNNHNEMQQQLIIRSAYGQHHHQQQQQEPMSPMQVQMQSSSPHYLTYTTTAQNNQQLAPPSSPQIIYATSDISFQTQQQQQQYVPQLIMEPLSTVPCELSPIRINPNYIHSQSITEEQKPGMISFGKQTEV